jgi:hypothetical protein
MLFYRIPAASITHLSGGAVGLVHQFVLASLYGWQGGDGRHQIEMLPCVFSP